MTFTPVLDVHWNSGGGQSSNSKLQKFQAHDSHIAWRREYRAPAIISNSNGFADDRSFGRKSVALRGRIHCQFGRNNAHQAASGAIEVIEDGVYGPIYRLASLVFCRKRDFDFDNAHCFFSHWLSPDHMVQVDLNR
jgi:hypothetical protein